MDWRFQPLVKRQARLQALLARFDCPAVLPSESFEDGLALLRVAEKRKVGRGGVEAARRTLPVGRLQGLAEDQDRRVA